ncbi:unnamed protein product [Spirodela intermedia]|uniref:Uncharacterized protein n=1 Tax=Spirodela intermedia TaxID=51605 RepID=A0A7I8IUQ5_SPIIN|nr:unnamed protein product [Spirodela intermedia]CAA6661715.1 unnamed protein product [Spirodela intermedia]
MNRRQLSLLFLLLLVSAHKSISGGAAARPLSFPDQGRYAKAFSSLGMRCECCDAGGGQCRSEWDSPA